MQFLAERVPWTYYPNRKHLSQHARTVTSRAERPTSFGEGGEMRNTSPGTSDVIRAGKGLTLDPNS